MRKLVLAQTVMQLGPVDQLGLLLHPVVVGVGRRLFEARHPAQPAPGPV